MYDDMRIEFVENGEKYWFDPETIEYEYDGENHVLLSTLDNIEANAQVVVDTSDMGGEATNFTAERREYDPEKAKQIINEIIKDEDGISVVSSSEDRWSEIPVSAEI